MTVLDEPRTVRAGEELDTERLRAFLTAHVPGAAGAITIEQFPHGHSNLTYLVRIGEQELVLRRPPVGNQVKSAHDMGREYHVLSHLCEVYRPAPRPVAYCDDPSVLDAPFYLMERRRGVVLRGTRAQLEPAIVRRLGETLIDHLAELHGLDYRAAGLGDLGRPEGYVERQVKGWTDRLQKAQTDPLPAMEGVAGWLEASRPTESGTALIHNDFKFDNLLLDPADLSRVVAVLDWEMATVGDPLMDLGTTLGYWVEADDPPTLKHMVVGPTMLPGGLSRCELAERYQKRSGREHSNLLFYYVFGLFKIAVIVQQIYARYRRGHTHDERFAHLDCVVAGLGQAASEAIDAGKF